MLLLASATANGTLSVAPILASILYALLGLIILMAAYKIFDIINPLDFDKELANNNIALSIMLAGFFISIAIIIASAIFG